MGFILLFSILGFLVSHHIWRAKKNQKRLACAVGSSNSCDIVVKSKYNGLFGIPNEINGILYYGFVAVTSAAILFGASAIDAALLGRVLLVSGAVAVVFSFFLTVIQVMVLKKWCEWCLVSAFLSIMIFVFEFLAFY